jgi:hypothetical protein
MGICRAIKVSTADTRMMRQKYFIVALLTLLVSVSSELVAQSPQMTNPSVRCFHWGIGGLQVAEGWTLVFWAPTTDPQGLGDIDSVWADGPGGVHVKLYDDGNSDDGAANDGNFGRPYGVNSPPTLGVYSFKARDKSGNLVSATDTLKVVLDYPRNITPKPGAVVSSSNFTIRWDRVQGATGYRVNVSKSGVNRTAWTYQLDSSQTSVTYNFDNTGENLVDGSTYILRVDAFDDHGNQGQRVDITFAYSTNVASPILSSPAVYSGDNGDNKGNQSYNLGLRIQVADPQGLGDIASVIVTGPDGKTYELSDDNIDGWYEAWPGGFSAPPQLGTYRFKVTDKAGNSAEMLDTLTAVIDYPRNAKPSGGEVVNTATPTFSWGAVPSAINFNVWVNDAVGKTIWARSGPITLSVAYNDDGLATANLKDGASYTWSVNSRDKDGNYGSNDGNRFTYSTNVASPILSNASALSGHDGADPGGSYYLDLRIQVVDPQGPSDIASVAVTGPTGRNYTLTDDNGDGFYDSRIADPAPPNFGVYKFKVTDKSGNWAEASDTLRAVLDYIRNARPANGEVVRTATPTFSWNAVPGATSYGINVRDASGKNIWGRGSLKILTAVYNDDGRAEASLKEGSTYIWNIGASDDDGNWCNQDNRFTYSTNVASPILSSPSAHSVHYGDDKGNQSYSLYLGIQVSDPQGLGDIASVIVTGPDGKTYPIPDNNDDGWYDAWFSSSSIPPQLGAYRFKVTDKSGNWAEALDTIKALLDYPRNAKPADGEVVLTSKPTFSLNAVQGATRYWIWVYDVNRNRIWFQDNVKTTSVVYNYDGRASADLKDGSTYTWHLGAADPDDNSGEQNERSFTYSTNPFSPVSSNANVRSRHWIDGDFRESWGLDFWVTISDPQGLTDIDSVWVDGPGNYHLRLFDDGQHSDNSANDGSYAYWTSGLNAAPTIGMYVFKARDKSGNLSSFSDTLAAVLDSPRNLLPQKNNIVSLPGFSISWDGVAGATWYEAAVNSLDWSKTYWSSGRG